MKDYLRQSSALMRGTIVKTNDDPKMQTLEVRGRSGERYTSVERFEPYGLSSHPMPPASEKDKQTAEVLLAYINGDPAHPVIVAASDRRKRPTKSKPGEVTLWDNQGQTLKLGEKGALTITGMTTLKLVVDGNTFTMTKDKTVADVGGTKVIITKDRVDLGGTGGSPVMTLAGPSTKVFAVK